MGDNLGLCKDCKNHTVGHSGNEPRAQNNNRMGGGPFKHFLTWSAMAIMMAIVVLATIAHNRPQDVPLVSLQSNASSTPQEVCPLGKRCVVCYLAPWCPACKSSLPIIQELRESFRSHNNLEFLVIVGAASQSELLPMANDIGGRVFFDPSSRFASAARIRSFPSIVLIDDQHRLTASSHVAYGGDAKDQFEYVSKQLGL